MSNLRFPDAIFIGTNLMTSLAALEVARSSKRVLLIDNHPVPMPLRLAALSLANVATPQSHNLDTEAAFDWWHQHREESGYQTVGGYYFSTNGARAAHKPPQTQWPPTLSSTADTPVASPSTEATLATSPSLTQRSSTFDQRDGAMEAAKLWRTNKEKLRRGGVFTVAGRVTDISGHPRAFRVTVQGVQYHAPKLVIASDEQLSQVLAALQLSLRLSPHARATAITETASRINLGHLVGLDTNLVEIRQDQSREIAISGELADGESVILGKARQGGEHACAADTLARIVHVACGVLPKLKDLALRYFFTAAAYCAEDCQPIIGSIAGIKGGYIALGSSRYCLTEPLLARLLAAHVLEDGAAAADDFDPKRAFVP